MAPHTRDDVTGLQALTARMATPVQEWIQPGDRYLRLGVDFTCTPRHLLDALRAHARKQGLQIGGRVDGNGVWIRPQRARSENLPREAFPHRYDDAPDTYASARPPAPPRRRSSPAARQVRLLSGPHLDRECGCGARDDSAEHDRWHAHWSIGVPIPPSTSFTHPIAVVDTTAPAAWRKLAYRCARLAQREGCYDAESFPHPLAGPTPDEDNRRAYLLATTTRDIGYLAVIDTTTHAAWDFSPQTPTLHDHTRRPQIDLIFVAHQWRRQAVATTLVRALATDTGTPLTALSWGAPFTEAGLALAKSLSPEQIWVS